MGKKIILVLFMAIVVAGLVFWMAEKGKTGGKTEAFLDGWTVKMNFLVEEAKEDGEKDTTRETGIFLTSLEEKLDGVTGTYGIFVYRLAEKRWYGISEAVTVQAASIMKVPVMVTVMKKIDEGEWKIDDKYTLESGDVRTDSGPLGFNPVGTEFTFEQMLSEMGKKSDNTAYTAFTRMLEKETVQKNISGWGLTNTLVEENTTTAKDVGKMWKKLYDGEILSPASLNLLWGDLQDSIYEDRIAAGLPAGVNLVHKVGTDEGVWSDSGIILGEKPLVMVIMTKDADREEAKILVPELARMIWDYESKRE